MQVKPQISVIIPIFNEERTVATIVELVACWGKADEIIIVNDGSTDNSARIILKLKIPNLKFINYKRNSGKGHALMAGIKKSNCDTLLFLDGDLTGLTRSDLDLIVEPVIKNRADMCLGLAKFWSANLGKFRFAPFNQLTGLRSLRKSEIAAHIKKMQKVGYGIELMLNNIYKDKRILEIKLPYTYVLGKFEKQTIPQASKSYIREARELIAQAVKQQASDLSPQARKLFNNIQNYLKIALETLQQPL